MSLPAALRLDATRLLQDPNDDPTAQDAGDTGIAGTSIGTQASTDPPAGTDTEGQREWNPVGLLILSVLALLLLAALVKWRRGLLQGAATSKELLVALWQGPNWWLVPVVLLLLPAALFLVLLKTVPVVAPFVYTVL